MCRPPQVILPRIYPDGREIVNRHGAPGYMRNTGRCTVSLSRLRQDWETLATLDPLWAILSDPSRRWGKWDLSEFLLTGDRQIAEVMRDADRLGYPREREVALDFGCGVGRNTRALAQYFRTCYGVDISDTMIARAREVNESVPGCEFVVNSTAGLTMFHDASVDMVYTCLVLQHMPNARVIKSYIAEFLRILRRDGLLVFQLLCSLPLKNRLQLRRRLFGLLSALGVNTRFLYERLGLYPIRIVVVPEREVMAFLDGIGAKVLEVRAGPATDEVYKSRTYYVTK
jgi:ubiquinone/menaquinone biosynthesis C-methylase UbiE